MPLLVLFAILNIVALVLVFLFVPETAGAVIANDPASEDGSLIAMSLEELNYIFAIPTSRHIKYQRKEVFRDYFVAKYLLRKPGVNRPTEFYRWREREPDGAESNDAEDNESQGDDASDTSSESNDSHPDPNANAAVDIEDHAIASNDNVADARQTEENAEAHTEHPGLPEHSTASGAMPPSAAFWQIINRLRHDFHSLNNLIAPLEAEPDAYDNRDDIPLLSVANAQHERQSVDDTRSA